MAKLKSRDFYPDFHVNIRKDRRVNGVEPVTLKDMGLPHDLDYPEQPVGELPNGLYENLVEEFIFLIDELLPRDIQDLFYKATLAPRRAYWKLFEEAARRMQIPYYLNCHRDDANGVYDNIRAGIECFLQEGRTLADIYLNTCITKEMLLDVVDWSGGTQSILDENVKKLFHIELSLFKSSKYNYKRFVELPGCEVPADLVLFGKEQNPELVVMVYDSEPEYSGFLDDDAELYAEMRGEYQEEQKKIGQVEQYCEQHGISFLKIGQYEAEDLYDDGDLGKIIRQAINNPTYAKEFVHRNDTSEDIEEFDNMGNEGRLSEEYLFQGKLKKICIDSNNVCYGPCPLPDEETEQHLTITADGSVLLIRLSFDNGQMEKTNFKIDVGVVNNLFDVLENRFSQEHELYCVTDVGSWEMILTNEEGKEFQYNGPLIENAGDRVEGLSDMVREATGRDDLFVFDGCPEKIDYLKLEYNRETKIKPKHLPEDAEYEFVTWNYAEVLTIDRATETLTNHIQFAEQCSVTNTYHVEEGISSLLDELWPEMFDDVTGNPPDAIDDPMNQCNYRITVRTQHGTEKTIEGSFDKLGLPDEYPEFIEKIYDFMAFYGIGELFNKASYGKAKRTSTDYIFCDVEFEPGGKTYCYLADNDSYEVGDTVLVPAGHDNHEALVRIVDKNYYSSENAPFPVDKAKHIIKRIDEDEIDDYLDIN